jgi:cytochrome P450
MTETTFEVITHTILAGCDADEGEVIRRAGQVTLDSISWSIAYAMLKLPEWLWHPGKARMLRAAQDERAAVARLVARRRVEADKRGDILGRLLEARHPDTGEPMSDEQLVDNLLTFLAAGHETTAKLLTWALYLLARAPDWQERLRAEALAVTGSAPIAADHIERLVLMQRVLKETMRLYPPAPVLTRVTAEEVELDGTTIDKGVLIVMPIYAVHRHRKVWDDPDRFDPDRFLPEREATYQRAQFMPFGFGPRTCIGSSFAMIEATAILATLVRGARFGWDGRHAPEPVSRVTLRPKGGMPLRVTVL